MSDERAVGTPRGLSSQLCSRAYVQILCSTAVYVALASRCVFEHSVREPAIDRRTHMLTYVRMVDLAPIPFVRTYVRAHLRAWAAAFWSSAHCGFTAACTDAEGEVEG